MLDYRPIATSLPTGTGPLRGIIAGIGSVLNVAPRRRPVTADEIRRRVPAQVEDVRRRARA